MKTIGRYDIDWTFKAKCSWLSPVVVREPGYFSFAWGCIYFEIEDWTDEKYALCAVCDSSEVNNLHWTADGLTFCRLCESVEQGYRYVNKRTWEGK